MGSEAATRTRPAQSIMSEQARPRSAAARDPWAARPPLPPIQLVLRRGEAALAPSSPPLAHADSSSPSRRATATHKSIGVSEDIQYPGANLRAKCLLDGWAHAESERTVLRKLDRAEDDGGVLRDDFTRLRGVSAHL